MDDLYIAREYASRLRRKLGGHVGSIVLFGSRARGDAHEGSDFDVLILLDEPTQAQEDLALEAGTEMLDRYDAFFAPVTWSNAKWERMRRTPIGWNILRE